MKSFFAFVFTMTLCMMLCACENASFHSDGIFQVTEETEPVIAESLTDNGIVSAACVYSRIMLDNPNAYYLGAGIRYDVYTDGTYLYVNAPSFAGNNAFLIYDTTGMLVKEVPYRSTISGWLSVSNTRYLSDGTVLYYGAKQGHADGSDIMICDTDGTVIYETVLSQNNNAMTSYLACTDIHVTENDDGSRNILIAETDTLYYLDGALNILETVSTDGVDYDGIYRRPDGLYILGDSVSQVCWVDMRVGYLEPYEDLPLPQGWENSCNFITYGGDGSLYCTYNDSVFQCDGEGGAKEILRFSEGACDSFGIYWVVDKSSVFYISYNPELPYDYQQLCLLKTQLPIAADSRTDLTLAVLSDENFDWLKNIILEFNAQSDAYRVTLLDFRYREKGDNPTEDFNIYLQENGSPDMVVFQRDFDSRIYTDKGMLSDLAPQFGDSLLGCARSAFTTDNGALYLLPLSMQAELFVSSSAILDGILTWDILQDMTDVVLHDTTGRQAVTSFDVVDHLMDFSLFDFYDTDMQSASFDTDTFRNRIRLLESLKTRGTVSEYGFLHRAFSTNFRYGLVDSAAIVDAIRTGDVRLLYVPFQTVGAYSVLTRIFGDTPFTLCGYPSADGNIPCISVNSSNLLGVFDASANPDGCAAFIAFLLSDEIQSSDMLLQNALPVTHGGFVGALEKHRYTYYSTMTAKSDLEPFDHSAFPKPDYLTLGYYSECILTDSDIETVYHFFDTATSHASPDATVSQIVTEELSAYESGAKTLEEITRLMQSRVSIYLNE